MPKKKARRRRLNINQDKGRPIAKRSTAAEVRKTKTMSLKDQVKKIRNNYRLKSLDVKIRRQLEKEKNLDEPTEGLKQLLLEFTDLSYETSGQQSTNIP